MNLEAIDQKITLCHAKLVKKHPHSCKDCMGRGGRLVPSYDGCMELIYCETCVEKGRDPLNTNLVLLPNDYLLEEYGASFDPTKIDEFELRECISPTNGEAVEFGSWGEVDHIQHLLNLKDEIVSLRERYDRLLSQN